MAKRTIPSDAHGRSAAPTTPTAHDRPAARRSSRRNTLRRVRTAAALIFFAGTTLLFLDFTGTTHGFLGWMARMQLVPAILAGSAIIIAAILLLTLLFGRVYCSVICPLGVMQDGVSRIGSIGRKNRFGYSAPLRWLRWTVAALFVVMLVWGVGTWIEPYSAYGRIASELFAPIYKWGNNLLAYLAERADSYAFYRTEVWLRGSLTLAVAAATLLVVGFLAWRGGRTYCNTICPVGTVLGLAARFSIFTPRLDASKCNSCGLCARSCKASCIDTKAHKIDYSRCVACMNCLDACNRDAMNYRAAKPWRPATEKALSASAKPVDASRRKFLSVVGIMAYAVTVRAQEKKVDGGLALLKERKVPDRATAITPPGSQSARNMEARCTACQLCVSVCPNNILHPSTALSSLMKPQISYERGFCRPECTRCSEVCPTGAIKPIDKAEKSATQIGHAVWIADNCVVNTDSVACGNCARHCPTGAILMVRRDHGDETSPLIPAVREGRCIGCGACEYVCPARPFSAIYVEGHPVHRTV